MSDQFNEPMMSQREIDYIDKLITDRKPKNVLEWGAGGSTVYFPRKHKIIISEWIAIEHDGEWYRRVFPQLENNVRMMHIKVQDYLKSVEGKKFDLIIIDGLMRQECLMVSEDMLNPDGIVLLHDSGRSEYQPFIKRWPRNKQRVFDGEIPVKTEGFAHRGLYKFSL